MTCMPITTETTVVRSTSSRVEPGPISRKVGFAAPGVTPDRDKAILVVALALLFACTVLIIALVAQPLGSVSLPNDDLPRYATGA